MVCFISSLYSLAKAEVKSQLPTTDLGSNHGGMGHFTAETNCRMGNIFLMPHRHTFPVGEMQHRVEEFCYFVFVCTTKPKYLLELPKYWKSMLIEVLFRTVYSLIII